MKTNAPSSPRWDPWPVSIIAFFAIAIVGCGAFITFCARHPADLISSNYYEEEVRYQGQMERLQRTHQRAQFASITYDATTKLITICVPPNQAQLTPSGQIQLYRPSAMNLDRQVKLELNPNGVQTIDAASLLPGLWKVRVSWALDHREYLLDQKLVIPSKPS